MIRAGTIVLRAAAAMMLLMPALAHTRLFAQIGFNDFASTAGLRMVGTAGTAPGNVLRLTPANADKVGAAWFSEPQYISGGFISTFSFRMLAPGGQSDGTSNGGDGFAFVIQRVGDSAIGFAGGSIGYDGIPRSVAIEFDTWDDGFAFNGDPNGNHISINTRGKFPNSSDHGWSLAIARNVPTFGNGTTHNVVVEYWAKTLTVFFDGCANPVLRTRVDLDSLLGPGDGRAWLGFTGATQSAWETHDILSWKSTSVNVALADTVFTICKGDSVVLRVPTLDGDVTWQDGVHAKSIVVRKSGVYTASVRDNLGCGTFLYTLRVRVDVIDIAEPVIQSTGSLSFCEGDSVVLDAGVAASYYRWSNNAATRSIVVRAPGSYSVTVGEPGCTKVSAPVTVRVLSPPAPIIRALGSVSICAGDSADLEAPAGYRSYRWSNGALGPRVRVGDSAEYRVEVVDSNGCTGSSAPLLVRVVRQPQPGIVPNGRTHFCDGDTVVLEASAGYYRYVWSTGDTGQALVVRRGGSYDVAVFTPEGCNGRSAPVAVTVNTPPAPVITAAGPTSFCFGDSVTLRAPAGFSAYLWSTGATADSIRVGAAGSYSVTVADTIGCAGTSPPVDVTVATTVAAVVTPRGPTSFCAGDSVLLEAPPGFATYAWSNGATTSSIIAKAAGDYSVAVTTASGCAGTSPAVRVTLFPPPPVPAITESSSVLTSDPAAAYQWAYEGSPIAGATARTLNAAREGNYTVTITDANGCTATSLPFAVASASAEVTVGSAEARAGETFSVPIMLDASHALDDRRLRNFTATLRFNRTLLVPQGATPTGTVSGNQRTVSISGVRPAGLVAGEIARLEFSAALGDSDVTPIVMESFVWTDGNAVSTTHDGLFRLAGVCTEGGPRLIGTGAAGLKAVRPNPASGSITVAYGLLERGRTRLLLLDNLGRTVRTFLDADEVPGVREATFNIDALPSGVYALALVTPSDRWVRRLSVVR